MELKSQHNPIVPPFDGKMPISRMIDRSLALCFRQWKLFLVPSLVYALLLTGYDYLTSSSVEEQVALMKGLIGNAEGGLDSNSLKEMLFSGFSGDFLSGPLVSAVSVIMLALLAAFFTCALKELSSERNPQPPEIATAMKKHLKSTVITSVWWLLFFGALSLIALPVALLPVFAVWSFSSSVFFTIFLSFVSITLALGFIVVFFARLLLFPMITADIGISGVEALKYSWHITASGREQATMERPVTRLTIILTLVTLIAWFIESFGSAPTDMAYMGLVSQLGGSLLSGGMIDVSSVLEQIVAPSLPALIASFMLQVALKTVSVAFILLAMAYFYFDLKARNERQAKRLSDFKNLLNGGREN